MPGHDAAAACGCGGGNPASWPGSTRTLWGRGTAGALRRGCATDVELTDIDQRAADSIDIILLVPASVPQW